MVDTKTYGGFIPSEQTEYWQHLKSIFSEGKLSENLVVKNFFTTASDGKKYHFTFYNLDAIISVLHEDRKWFF
jgi:hypothetical protein